MKKTVLMIVSAVMATMMAMIATGCGSSSSEVSKTAPTIPKATNATTAPVPTTTPVSSRSTGNTDTTTATRAESTTATEATEETAAPSGDLPSAAAASAMAYFSVSADVGATVEVLGQETTPAGTVFYQVNVYYAGNAYPLFVSADGSYCVEPENFYSTYGGGRRLRCRRLQRL